MYLVEREQEFLSVLQELPFSGKKLVYGKTGSANVLRVSAEIRPMITNGGYQFGIAQINYLNQRGSGQYTRDVETLFLYACDIPRDSLSSWHLVPNSEHTPDSVY